MREINLGDLVISGLGNFTNYSTANINDPILQVLSKIRDKKLYCLPLINNEGIYIDSFTSSDVRVFFN
ncbi:AMP-activated serine/threonine-protein kinase regulatory subunit [Bonamia ostreae]|uniref:AMP-activated serine/threonine-protein kinase regulatory subunit n=1 Tax=Bonamia ostreae TaxID=126728 RepID=A0ABV2ARU6_9EUKA